MRNLQPLEQPPEVRTSLTGSGVPVNLRSCSAPFDTFEPVWELRGTLLVRRERLVQVFESWKRKMRQARILLCTVLILGIVPALSINSISRVYAETPYSLNPVPAFTQKEGTAPLVLPSNIASVGTPFDFIFP